MALTEAQKRANQKAEKARKDRGEVKRTYWMTPETLARIQELRASHKSNDRVIEEAIRAYQRPVATHLPAKPAKPASEPEKRPSVAYGSRLKKR